MYRKIPTLSEKCMGDVLRATNLPFGVCTKFDTYNFEQNRLALL